MHDLKFFIQFGFVVLALFTLILCWGKLAAPAPSSQPVLKFFPQPVLQSKFPQPLLPSKSAQKPVQPIPARAGSSQKPLSRQNTPRGV